MKRKLKKYDTDVRVFNELGDEEVYKVRDYIKEKIENSKEIIKKHQKIIDNVKGKVFGNLDRLRDALSEFKKSDEKLYVRIKELFKREGLTIGSILTAIVMLIWFIWYIWYFTTKYTKSTR